MLEMQISPATIVIGLVIIGLAILAVRRLVKKGTCDCKECAGGEACSGCNSVDKMIADMEKAAK